MLRKIDKFGRIILPVEIRNKMGWDTNTKIEIIEEGASVILYDPKPKCFSCGGNDNLHEIKNINLCSKCLTQLVKNK